MRGDEHKSAQVLSSPQGKVLRFLTHTSEELSSVNLGPFFSTDCFLHGVAHGPQSMGKR